MDKSGLDGAIRRPSIGSDPLPATTESFRELAHRGTLSERGEAQELALPAMSVPDLTEYLADIEDMDLTEDQKLELLGVMWSILRTMVELSFDLKRSGQIMGAFAAASKSAE